MHGYGSLRRRSVRFGDRLVNHYFQTYGTVVAVGTYAFVFGYYGFLKVQALFTGLKTPVRGEVGALVSTLGLGDFGISLTMVMVFIGAVAWLFDSFAAYILKNTTFLGGLLVLAAVELGHDRPARATEGPESVAVE